jgi:capsular polysaccharide export protein
MFISVKPHIKIHTDILLLQGPVGDFFHDLRDEFEARGFKTRHIAFDKADEFTGSLRFRGRLETWVSFFEQVIIHETPRIIVVFGDSRPHHAKAIEIARYYGVKIISLEEGYFRPGFITVENEGNNVNSPLSFLNLTDLNPQKLPKSIKISDSQSSKYKSAVLKYINNAIMTKQELNISLIHRPRCLIRETFYWLKNGFLWLIYAQINKIQIKKLQHQSYFIVALQVHDDAQIITHGKGWNAERLIHETLLSFSLHAQKHQRLVFKIHPLDRGHFPYAQIIKKEAARLNLSRIDILHTGNLGGIVKYSNGFITINSTGGLVALSHLKPVITLGKCFYNRAGLTFEGSLDDFWTKALPPDKDLWAILRSHIYSQSLVQGCWYSKKYRRETVNNVVTKILRFL